MEFPRAPTAISMVKFQRQMLAVCDHNVLHSTLDFDNRTGMRHRICAFELNLSLSFRASRSVKTPPPSPYHHHSMPEAVVTSKDATSSLNGAIIERRPSLAS